MLPASRPRTAAAVHSSQLTTSRTAVLCTVQSRQSAIGVRGAARRALINLEHQPLPLPQHQHQEHRGAAPSAAVVCKSRAQAAHNSMPCRRRLCCLSERPHYSHSKCIEPFISRSMCAHCGLRRRVRSAQTCFVDSLQRPVNTFPRLFSLIFCAGLFFVSLVRELTSKSHNYSYRFIFLSLALRSYLKHMEH